jgi:hypothetical protein
VTDNLYIPFGGFYPEDWFVDRRPCCRSLPRLLALHRKRISRRWAAGLVPFAVEPMADLNDAQRELDRVNTELGFLNPRGRARGPREDLVRGPLPRLEGDLDAQLPRAGSALRLTGAASWPQPAAMSMPRRWRTVLGKAVVVGEDALEAPGGLASGGGAPVARRRVERDQVHLRRQGAGSGGRPRARGSACRWFPSISVHSKKMRRPSFAQ